MSDTRLVGKIDLDDHPITVWLRQDPDGSYVVDVDTGDDDADISPEQVPVEVCLNDGLLARRDRGYLDLYHRTTPEAAQALQAGANWRSQENHGGVFFSNRRDGQASGYGNGVVHVRVPAFLAQLDDEFPDGEQHFKIKAHALNPQHIVLDPTNS